MKVLIPTPLRSYTDGQHQVTGKGASVRELLVDLDRRYPGIRFRMVDEQDAMRPHMRIFVNAEPVFALDTELVESDEVQILQALSGG
jgi:molybdopterin synthase sulfur carrier subunit